MIEIFPPIEFPPAGKERAWTPSYSNAGGGSFGTVTVSQAFWWPLNNNWTGIYVRVLGTVTGVVTRIQVSNLPQAASTTWGQLPLKVAIKNQGGGTTDQGGAAIMNGADQIVVHTSDGSNWTTGAGRGFQILGAYPNA